MRSRSSPACVDGGSSWTARGWSLATSAKATDVLEALVWGLVGGAALLVGALIGVFAPASQLVIGLVMGFGAGVLISALAFELTSEAFHRGGADAVAAGLAAGAITFFVGDWIIDHRG